jgi:hypothetical protein
VIQVVLFHVVRGWRVCDQGLAIGEVHHDDRSTPSSAQPMAATSSKLTAHGMKDAAS